MRRQRMDFAFDNLEAIDDLLAYSLGLRFENLTKCRDETLLGQKCEPLFDGASDQIDVARMGIKIPHEIFNALADRTVAITKIVRDGGLDASGQNIDGPADVVMHFISHAQQKIVSGPELLAFVDADHFLLPQFRERSRAV